MPNRPPSPARPVAADPPGPADPPAAAHPADPSGPDGRLPVAIPGIGYQPALDGWRGLGILMVMAYHAGLQHVIPGAFLWIDGFFTVSAFLIATLLLEEHASHQGRVALGAFWGRRVRRLGPALLVLLAGMGLFALVADRSQLAALPKDVLATLFYVANWRSIAGGTDYFAAFVSDSPLKHAWSLAIEEQFYLLFPVLLVGLFAVVRRTRRDPTVVLGVVAATGAVVSALWMGWLHAQGAATSRLYYGTDTRAQSLLVGVALAAWWRASRARHHGADPADVTARRRRVVAVGATAFAALVVAQFAVREDSVALYTGGFLLAALAQAMVFRAAVEPSWFQRALAWAPLVWVGGLAYGLYLFHFPVFLWLSPARTGLDGPALLVVRFAVTFAIAIPVHRLVEQPVRRRLWPRPGTLSARLAWPAAVASIALVALLVRPPAVQPSKQDLLAMVAPAGGVTTAAGPVPSGSSARPAPAAVDPSEPSTTASTGGVYSPTTEGAPSPAGGSVATSTAPGSGAGPAADPRSVPPATAGPSSRSPRVVVVGDSTGTRLAPGLEAWSIGTGAAVWAGDGARVGCPLGRGGDMHTAADATGPVPVSCDWATTPAVGFDGVERPTWSSIVAGWHPDLVVVSFGPWDVADRQLPGDPVWRFPGDPAYDAWMRQQMTTAIDTLTAGGARVVWLTQPPWEGATRHPPERLYAPSADPARMARFNVLAGEVAASRPGSVTVVDLAGWLASTGDDARLRPDGAHLEPETAVEVMNRFLGEQLLAAWRAG